MTINSKQPHQQLCARIAKYSRQARETRQVSRRLKQLLPNRLKSLHKKYRQNHTYGAAERCALIDPDYIDHIEEYVEINSSSLKARIEWESHMMLFEARRSMRAFQR